MKKAIKAPSVNAKQLKLIQAMFKDSYDKIMELEYSYRTTLNEKFPCTIDFVTISYDNHLLNGMSHLNFNEDMRILYNDVIDFLLGDLGKVFKLDDLIETEFNDEDRWFTRGLSINMLEYITSDQAFNDFKDIEGDDLVREDFIEGCVLAEISDNCSSVLKQLEFIIGLIDTYRNHKLN